MRAGFNGCPIGPYSGRRRTSHKWEGPSSPAAGLALRFVEHAENRSSRLWLNPSKQGLLLSGFGCLRCLWTVEQLTHLSKLPIIALILPCSPGARARNPTAEAGTGSSRDGAATRRDLQPEGVPGSNLWCKKSGRATQAGSASWIGCIVAVPAFRTQRNAAARSRLRPATIC